MKNINTKEYWDDRFATQLGRSDWEMCNGHIQSQDFMSGIISNIPKKIKEDMKDSSILDVGCAMGDGTDLLYKRFSNNVTGYDFSTNALSVAKKKYTDITFINQIELVYDYVICSNMLQCVDDYKKQIKELLNHTSKCLFILVPMGENGTNKENYNIFNSTDFSKSIDGFLKRVVKTINVNSWAYKQLFIRYERMNWDG